MTALLTKLGLFVASIGQRLVTCGDRLCRRASRMQQEIDFAKEEKQREADYSTGPCVVMDIDSEGCGSIVYGLNPRGDAFVATGNECRTWINTHPAPDNNGCPGCKHCSSHTVISKTTHDHMYGPLDRWNDSIRA